MKRKYAHDILLGLATGDALGVPVEFKRREEIALSPVTTMLGNGTHNQLPGTWSDDSALAFCLAEALAGDFSLKAVADNFINWFHHGYWSARGSVFDVGIATQDAILQLEKGGDPELAGGQSDRSNGNGSLMRILPLALLLRDKLIDERFLLAKQVSSLTHAHIGSVIACFIYLELAHLIIKGNSLPNALETLRNYLPDYLLNQQKINAEEVNHFHRILSLKVGIYDVQPLENMPADSIDSSGYVVATLEASIWCLLTTSNYTDAVLKAVNLGSDTDTTACVTGGLAGLLYGYETIPADWLAVLARKADIEILADKLAIKYPQGPIGHSLL